MINSIMRNSPVRMMGLSSGMDTDFIVQQSMRAHQVRIDAKIRQRTLIEWRQQTHNSIRDQLREFSGSFLSMTSTRSMMASANYRDVDSAINNIKNFIDSYNVIISRIEGLLREQKKPSERSYLPLTDEEKRSMSEKQIADWEAIARKGIMRNDSALENLARDLRNSFFNEIEGLGLSPSALGLSTGSFFDKTGGKIFINESRLRAELEADPDKVFSVFTRTGATIAEQGLVSRINSLVSGFISHSGSQNNTLKGLERSFRNVNERIDRLTLRMFAEEDRLYRQFAAMESAMSRLQSQGDWFASMLGGFK